MGNTDNNDEFSTVNHDERPSSGLRRKLYIIIFEADTPAGKKFDIILLWIILISIIQVILESDQSIQNEFSHIFHVTEWIVTIFFTIEYSSRLYVSKKPLKYARSFYGIVDFVATIPTYISFILPGTQFLLVIRVLRLLRIFRILKLVRFIRAANILGSALYSSRHKIAVFFGVILSLVLILGTGMYIIEGQQSGFSSIPKSMYWAIVTMTTVGYGDIVPLTTAGKFLASVMMLTGYAIIAVPTGIVTAELSEATKTQSQTTCPRCKSIGIQNANYCDSCGESLLSP